MFHDGRPSMSRASNKSSCSHPATALPYCVRIVPIISNLETGFLLSQASKLHACCWAAGEMATSSPIRTSKLDSQTTAPVQYSEQQPAVGTCGARGECEDPVRTMEQPFRLAGCLPVSGTRAMTALHPINKSYHESARQDQYVSGQSNCCPKTHVQRAWDLKTVRLHTHILQTFYTLQAYMTTGTIR